MLFQLLSPSPFPLPPSGAKTAEPRCRSDTIQPAYLYTLAPLFSARYSSCTTIVARFAAMSRALP
jgi:hypothetical protein